MKCFTNEWYRNNREFTDEIVAKAKERSKFQKENYQYYPQWYKERNDNSFIFEEAVIKKFVQKKAILKY